jgi:hypothetical protein
MAIYLTISISLLPLIHFTLLRKNIENYQGIFPSTALAFRLTVNCNRFLISVRKAESTDERLRHTDIDAARIQGAGLR